MHSVVATRAILFIKHACLKHLDEVGSVRLATVRRQVKIVVLVPVQVAQKMLRMRLVAFKNVWSRSRVPTVGLMMLVMHLVWVTYHCSSTAILDIRWGCCGHHVASMRFRLILRRRPTQIDSIFIFHEVVSGALHPRRLVVPCP